ncbi:MAG: NUDIX hydrolase [Candidatus Gracilibacteria bacterium]|nr:NUDIX hydrolase [Candidatus Gracilibacteria bacterium]
MLKVAASGLILRKDNDNEKKQVLLIKRGSKTKAFPNYWSFPGGKLEEGETLFDAAIREVKEEIDLIFTPSELFYTSENNGFKLNRFLGTWEGKIKIKEDELNGYGWFTSEEIEKLDIAFDNKKVLDILKEKNLID